MLLIFLLSKLLANKICMQRGLLRDTWNILWNITSNNTIVKTCILRWNVNVETFCEIILLERGRMCLSHPHTVGLKLVNASAYGIPYEWN